MKKLEINTNSKQSNATLTESERSSKYKVLGEAITDNGFSNKSASDIGSGGTHRMSGRFNSDSGFRGTPRVGGGFRGNSDSGFRGTPCTGGRFNSDYGFRGAPRMGGGFGGDFEARSHIPARQQFQSAAPYVWRVEWFDRYKNRMVYKAFYNKQRALFFMSDLECDSNNLYVSLEKWSR